jgi:hypothetical protein
MELTGHYLLNDGEFEQKLISGTLDPALFSHEAHLRLAYIHIKKYGLEQAIENICSQITNYVRYLGAEDKYNQTLTVAAVKIVEHFIRKATATTFCDMVLEFPRLKHNFKDLIEQHYGFDIFHSEKAKAEFLEPDLIPF